MTNPQWVLFGTSTLSLLIAAGFFLRALMESDSATHSRFRKSCWGFMFMALGYLSNHFLLGSLG